MKQHIVIKKGNCIKVSVAWYIDAASVCLLCWYCIVIISGDFTVLHESLNAFQYNGK